ncbi:hypothetical protein BH10ACT1_BH10ACT1_18810 [soil metagenome]
MATAAVGGGAFIATGDHLFHVRTRVLVHHWHPQWDGQTLLVYPLFVAAAALMVVVAAPLVEHLPRPGTPRALGAAGAFAVAYAFTGQVGVAHPGWCLTVLVATFAARLALEPDRRTVLAVGALIAIGGCAGEAAVSALGLFTYVRPAVAGVPLWLFPLYLHGAPAVVAVARLAHAPAPSSG